MKNVEVMAVAGLQRDSQYDLITRIAILEAQVKDLQEVIIRLHKK